MLYNKVMMKMIIINYVGIVIIAKEVSNLENKDLIVYNVQIMFYANNVIMGKYTTIIN